MNVGMDFDQAELVQRLAQFWPISGEKIAGLCRDYEVENGTPVFTVQGRYTSKGWTEWTQGFQYGWAILQFDATGDEQFLELGRQGTLDFMASHVSHVGVHDHGFNNVSTYGNLRRLMLEGRIPRNDWEMAFYEVALKASGAVQADRWTKTHDGGGFIHSFNGPQSLFADTMRTVRALSLAHALGHRLMGENDESISLLDRGIDHARTTAQYAIFYGDGRDIYDVAGRVAHESLFNPTDGRFRSSSTQQGYSGFTTWTRGLAWVMAGFAEQLEFLATVNDDELEAHGGRFAVEQVYLTAARVTCDFYLSSGPADGIPYWDTGAPRLIHIPDLALRAADPFNHYEPVDSSSAAIAVQAFLRLGRYLQARGDESGTYYVTAGLQILNTLLGEPYLSVDPHHQGLLLHGVYHRPRGWDYCPDPDGVPRGEAVMWGDYHLVESALMAQRLLVGAAPYYTFFGPTELST